MNLDGTNIFDRLLLRGSVRRLSGAAKRADKSALSPLRRLRAQARQLQREVERFLCAADARLSMSTDNAASIPRPEMADWAWRPEVWSRAIRPSGFAAIASGTAIGQELKLFHDCSESEITLRQIRNADATDLAPWGLRLDVFRFAGSYLSLVVDLPTADASALRARHILRIDARIDVERPVEIFARLNIRNGPNTEQMVRELPRGRSDIFAEFDLAYGRINDKRLERAWVDIIFEGPEMNQITLRDVTFSRRPRAEL